MKPLTTLFIVTLTTALLAGGFMAGRMTLPQGATCMASMPILGDE